MRSLFALTAIWFLPILAYCQTDNSDPAVPIRTYSLLRENEDWSWLANPALREDYADRIKYLPLGRNGWYVTLGGEIREVLEQVVNDNFGKQGYTNRFLLQRYMLHSDWHLGRRYRIFVQLKSGLESYRTGGPRPIDEKKLDVEAAFLEVGTDSGKNWIVLRLGRQELNYGSGRLVSVREGPTVRQSFDGVKVRSKAGAWKIDAFAVRPDLDRPGFFDNIPDPHTEFWGIYATRPLRRQVSFDSYYLGEDRKVATFERGTATELRHSVGGKTVETCRDEGIRPRFRLRRRFSVWKFWFGQHPRVDAGLRYRLQPDTPAAKAAFQRQGGYLQRRRSSKPHFGNLLSGIPAWKLFWCARRYRAGTRQLY